MLPYTITVNIGHEITTINKGLSVWEQIFATEEEQSEAILDYGREIFGQSFVDYIPLKSSIGGVTGVAFILPFSPSPSSKTNHRVYLKKNVTSRNSNRYFA